MSDATDIRDWARSKGYEVGARGNLPRNIRDAYQAEHGAPESEALSEVPDADDDGAPPETPPETAPKTAGEITPRSTGRKTPPKKRRVSVEGVAGGAWTLLSRVLGGDAHPVGRVLALQSPVAGLVIEDAVKGTAVDSILQPLARLTSGGKQVGALIGPPLLVGAITQRPALYPVLREPLAECLLTWYEIAADKQEELRKRVARLEKKMGEKVDVYAAIDAIFAPPQEAPQPESVVV